MAAHSSIDTFEWPYQPDTAKWFERIRSQGHAVWLDSNHGGTALANQHMDIISAGPVDTIRYSAPSDDPPAIDRSDRTPDHPLFEQLEQFANRYVANSSIQNPPSIITPGLIGYLSYETGYPLQYLAIPAPRHATIPLMYFGFYPWLLMNDHAQKRCTVVYLNEYIDAESIKAYLKQTESTHERFELTTPWQPSTEQDDYQHAVNTIKDYLEAGDCYQVNYTQCFSAHFQGNPFHAYRHLRQAYPSPYAAYLELPEAALLSVSPELFLDVNHGQVTTKPIKGTRPRHPDAEGDRANAEALQHDPKDRAENIMIVDLMRNDLARCCQPGTVTVPEYFQVEPYRAVHHLVSTVTGTLRDDCSPIELLKHTFPGGSITGAPKRRAMEIIHELEPFDRQAYCGTIGRIGIDGSIQMNIAIRTAVCHQSTIRVWGGGGIVMDSNPADEYQESLDKIGSILECLSSLNENNNE